MMMGILNCITLVLSTRAQNNKDVQNKITFIYFISKFVEYFCEIEEIAIRCSDAFGGRYLIVVCNITH